jgi:uncharacterized protein YjiS (DUF1127 family)
MKFEQAIINLTSAAAPITNDNANVAANDAVATKAVKTAPTPSFVDNLNRWMKVHGAARCLNKLDDRTLRDIGLARIEIREQAEKLVNNSTNVAANDSVATKAVKTASTPNFVDSLNRWVKVHGVARCLNKLDDRTLRDIGLSRIEIRQQAEKLVNNRTAA